jgi:hypothetical protein
MDLRTFVTEAGANVWKLWSGYDQKFNAGDNFILWLAQENSTTKGLGYANGIITLPSFEDPDSKDVHWTQDYDNGTSTFYGWANDGGVYRRDGAGVQVQRDLNKAYKLVDINTNGEFTKNLDFGNSGFTSFAATGNPYMSSINFKQLQNNNATLFGGTYWLWVGAGVDNNPPGSYLAYNTLVGSLGNTATPLNEYISPMQSFIIARNDGATGTEMTFNIANISATGSSSGLRGPVLSTGLLEIIASSSKSSIRTVIASNENGSQMLNNLDSRKLFAGINSLPDIYTLKPDANNNPVAVLANILPEIKEEILIPLVVSTTYEGPITFSFAGMDNYNARIYFIDTASPDKAGIELTGKATFSSPFNYLPEKVNGAAVANENRFFIRMSPFATGFDSASSGATLIYSPKAGTIQAVSVELIQQLSVFNMQGQKIYDNASVNSCEHTVSGLAVGVYVVKLMSKNEVTTKKITIK